MITVQNFRVTFRDRSGADVLLPPGGVEIVPVRWGWNAVGGPEFALIRIEGRGSDLWDVLRWLEYGVTINNGVAPLWWGFVETITLRSGGMRISVSLRDMANSVAVEHGDGRTGFLQDADSVAEYKEKQKIIPAIVGVDSAQRQAIELAYSKLPRPVQEMSAGSGDSVALECSGLLRTLDWLYFSRADGLVEYVGGEVEQKFGIGLTGNTFWFRWPRRLHDTEARLNTFKQGTQLYITGSAGNNGAKKVQTGTEIGQTTIVSGKLNFAKTGGGASYFTLWESDWRLKGLWPGDVVKVTGSNYNNGYYIVTEISAQSPGEWIKLSPDAVANEVWTPGVTLTVGHYIELATDVVEEMPGASVTIIADGQKVAQSFVPATGWRAETIRVRIRKQDGPTDNVRVSLYTDGGGLPGASLATAELVADQISANMTWTQFSLSTGVDLTGGTTYWIVVERLSGTSLNGYYLIGLDEDAGYTSGALKIFDGATWINRPQAASMLFRVEGSEQTTDQITRLVTDTGNFLSGTTIEDASAIRTNPYRDGMTTALQELRGLLDLGTSNGRRLLCEVREDNSLRVYEEPVYDENKEIILDRDGVYSKWGTELLPGSSPVGRWMRIRQIFTPDGTPNNPATVFVEKAEYAPQRGYKIIPRGAIDPWKLAAVRE